MGGVRVATGDDRGLAVAYPPGEAAARPAERGDVSCAPTRSRGDDTIGAPNRIWSTAAAAPTLGREPPLFDDILRSIPIPPPPSEDAYPVSPKVASS